MVINICGPAQQQIPIIYIDSPPSTTWLTSPKKRGLHIRRPTTHDPKNSQHLPKIPLFSSNDEWLSLSKTYLSLPRSLSVIMKNPSPFSVERVGEWVGEAEFFQKSVLTHFGLIALSLSLSQLVHYEEHFVNGGSYSLSRSEYEIDNNVGRTSRPKRVRDHSLSQIVNGGSYSLSRIVHWL